MFDEYVRSEASVDYKYEKTVGYTHSSDTSRIEFKMIIKVPRS